MTNSSGGLAHDATLLASRGLGLKVGLAAGVAVLVLLVLLSPRAVGITSAAAGCEPTSAGEAGAPPAPGPTGQQQAANARTIDQFAVRRGLPGHTSLLALMAALQESTLLNLNYGDRGSLGLFQQRPSAG